MARGRYQGAFVKRFLHGLFVGLVVHNDVKSMYPMIMAVFNLSPESVHFVSRGPYTGDYRFDYEHGIIEVPDKNIGQLVCRIDREDSVARREMIRMFELRQELRKVKDKAHEAMQTAVKLSMNACYGYLGMSYARYGSFLCAIIITAIGRLIIQEIVLGACYERGVKPLECDTDGLYSFGVDISDLINERLHERFKDYPLNHLLRVDTNKYDGMLLVKMKNYVLKNGDTLIFKGSGFHGRQLPNLIDMAFERFARACFANVESLKPIWAEFTPEALRGYALSDFAMAVEINKPPEEYAAPKSEKHKGNLYWQLCNALKGEVEFGDEIQYVKTIEGYLPLGVLDDAETLERIDFKYYHARIVEKIKWMLEVVNDPRYHTLDDFMGKKKRKRRTKRVVEEEDGEDEEDAFESDEDDY